MTNDCKTCPVSTGTHKPAEAVHQIDEPGREEFRTLVTDAARAPLLARIAELESQLEAIGAGGVEPLRKCNKLHQVAEPAAPVGKPIEDAIDALVMAAFTEGGCSAHRMSEARIRTELRKKELRTLLSTPQPCSRSHPHEEMTPMCELRTEIARLTNALARAEAAAPQAVQDAVPLFWVRLLRDGLYEGPVHNNSVGGKMLRDEKPGEWHPLYLHTAPAHPAEGVPALEVDDAMALAFHHALSDGQIGDDDLEEIKIGLRAVLANVTAPHPTQQGLDALHRVKSLVCLAINQPTFTSMKTALRVANKELDAALAAQAKQGGVEHG